MARVRSIPSEELPPDLADTYERFAAAYGPFRNQVAVLAHVPAALRHLMPLLMEATGLAATPGTAVSGRPTTAAADHQAFAPRAAVRTAA